MNDPLSIAVFLTALCILAVSGIMIYVLTYHKISAHRLLKREMRVIASAVRRFAELNGKYPYGHSVRSRIGVTFGQMLPEELRPRVFWALPTDVAGTYYVVNYWPTGEVACTIEGRCESQKFSLHRELHIRRRATA